MEATTKTSITIASTIHAPIKKVWDLYTAPAHIIQWNNASDDWHTPFAENDLREGGKFLSRMEAKDGSFGFDFEGIYSSVKIHEHIHYTMGDGRNVQIHFTPCENETRIVTTFEAEDANSIDLQKSGWQAILDNFKKYVESN